MRNSVIAIIIRCILGYILENSNISEMQAIKIFYDSNLYAALKQEDSNLWTYSPRLLYTLYQDELLTGSFEYPQAQTLIE